MSDLEAQNIPLIGCVMEDIAAPLDAAQQSLLAVWAMKTAMVLDSVKGRRKSLFYPRIECAAMRENNELPARTRIWIGRSSVSGLAAVGTDLKIVLPDMLRVGTGCATTIIVGHFAVQVLAIHAFHGHERQVGDIAPKPGRWDEMLLPIWPVRRRPIAWPPAVTFTGQGERSVAILADRWRLGRGPSVDDGTPENP